MAYNKCSLGLVVGSKGRSGRINIRGQISVCDPMFDA